MTLTEFLLARIAEDEHPARMASEGWVSGDGMLELGCWDEKRVLAECEAKRRIVEMAQTATSQETEFRALADANPLSEEAADMLAIMGGVRTAADAACESLAAVYADHLDYQQEWAV